MREIVSPSSPSSSSSASGARPVARYSGWYLVIGAVFVTCLIIANIIAVKVIALPGGFVAPAAIVIFPLSYLFGDVLTEVYGYAAARRVIWLGFGCNLLAVAAIYIGLVIPAAPFWQTQQSAYVVILGFTPILLLASFCAYLVGEFVNSFVLAKLKIFTRGRWLWTRTIGSTLVGEGLDSLIFITIAFGIGEHLPASVVVTLMLTQWTIKVLYEVIATPFTYAVVGFLKRREGLDPFDTHTNFSPIVLARAHTPQPSSQS